MRQQGVKAGNPPGQSSSALHPNQRKAVAIVHVSMKPLTLNPTPYTLRACPPWCSHHRRSARAEVLDPAWPRLQRQQVGCKLRGNTDLRLGLIFFLSLLLLLLLFLCITIIVNYYYYYYCGDYFYYGYYFFYDCVNNFAPYSFTICHGSSTSREARDGMFRFTFVVP